MTRFLLAEQEDVKLMAQEVDEEHERRERRRHDGHRLPLDAREAAHEPEHGASHLCLVLRPVNREHRQGGKERRDAHSHENEAHGTAAPPRQKDHERRRKRRAEKGADVNAIAEKLLRQSRDDADDGARARSRRNTEDIGIGKIILRDRLHQKPRESQSGSGKRRKKDARQADVEEDHRILR